MNIPHGQHRYCGPETQGRLWQWKSFIWYLWHPCAGSGCLCIHLNISLLSENNVCMVYTSKVRASELLTDQKKKWFRLRHRSIFFFNNAKIYRNLLCAKRCNCKTYIMQYMVPDPWMYREISFRSFYLTHNYLLAETWIVLG